MKRETCRAIPLFAAFLSRCDIIIFQMALAGARQVHKFDHDADETIHWLRVSSPAHLLAPPTS